MQMRRMASRAALIASALVLVVQVSSVAANGRGSHHGRVSVTFTKWVLVGADGTGTLMEGTTGGDIEGVFFGEVFVNTKGLRVPAVSRLEVVYGVAAADNRFSFTSLVRGGALQGKAILDGVILGGWRKGAQIHAEWTATPPAGCPPPPAGTAANANCFIGTMTIDRLEDDDD